MAAPSTGEFVPRKGNDFSYVSDVNPLLQCGLCTGALYQPQETECEHYFCRMCLEANLTAMGACPTCPSCSEPLSLKTPFKKTTRIVKELTGELLVRCTRTAYNTICGVIYKRDEFTDHLKSCEKKLIPCPRCNDMIYRMDLRSHESQCVQGAGFGMKEDIPEALNSSQKNFGSGGWKFNASPQHQHQHQHQPQQHQSNMEIDSPGKGFAFNPPSAMPDLNTPPLSEVPVGFEIGTSKSTSNKRRSLKHRTHRSSACPATTDVSMSPPPTPASPKLPPFAEKKENNNTDSNMWSSESPVQNTPVLPPADLKQQQQQQQQQDEVRPTPPKSPQMVPMEPVLKPVKKKEASVRRTSKEKTSKKLKMMGDDAYEKGDYDTAIDMWSQAVDMDDGTTKLTVVFGNRSAARFMSQQYNECITDCKAALEEDRSNAKLWNRMAKAACSMGKIDLAIRLLKTALQDPKLREKGGKDLDSVERELLTCQTVLRALDHTASLLADKKHHEAESELNVFVAKYSDWPQVIIGLSRIFVAKQQSDQALSIIDKPLAVASAKPGALDSSMLTEALLVKCTALYLKGFDKMKEAIKVAQDGLSISPDNKDLADLAKRCKILEERKEKGNEKFRCKEWVKSAQLYTEGLEIAGDCPEIAKVLHTNRAAARKEMKQYKLAVDDCTHALGYDPKFARAYTRRGRCHIELNDFEKAITDFKAAQRTGGPSQDLTDMLRDAERRKDAKVDFYSLLGASHSFNGNCEKTMKELKSKYKELCLRWHPDKIRTNSEDERKEAEKKIKQINEAYATLTDPQRRREYDKTLMLRRSNSAASFSHSFSHFGASRYGAGYGYSSYGGL
eukprot:TRINITY_DN1153_c0_g1_i4.p1 TRINITY_DN1153_c0_g1~~TRINITY_DN1153_c0_g1_i4.p1  ORF type:complete len:867 (+),score=174.84 TRINITY_DN1153_c0_g1_i4:75-2603(+)